jgi:uncharacterized integral membrane protein
MRRLGRFIWLIITMFLVAVAIAFVTSNKVLITLYLWPFDGMLIAPIWLVVISSFIIGGLLSIFNVGPSVGDSRKALEFARKIQ